MQSEKLLEGKNILVTGGTGSLGRVLTHRLLTGELGVPNRVTILSRDEAKHHQMRGQFARAKDLVASANKKLFFRLGDIRNVDDITGSLHDIDIVLNCAALKQVPNCEYFPEQAILTNCIGPTNILKAIRDGRFPVETVVGISTDKACQPNNVMGLTKALHEKIFIAGNLSCPNTRFVCTRYGNVLASRGSVIPLFHDQIRRGGPLTITVPNMTRFFMSLNEAVTCIFETLKYGKPGDIYIPSAPATTIENLAKALIGDRKIQIKYTGIRPGEKLHEVLISAEEMLRSEPAGEGYVIHSSLPELLDNSPATGPLQVQGFSSDDQVISLEETYELLQKNHLLLEQQLDYHNAPHFRFQAA
ncbi:Capsular polysaccharide biosynthesis protein capd [Planctomycetales bacterium 10988]|nr:Capsular polysaccharide biosynthesis protein capd [Planctomycetales bacterium 10988]